MRTPIGKTTSKSSRREGNSYKLRTLKFTSLLAFFATSIALAFTSMPGHNGGWQLAPHVGQVTSLAAANFENTGGSEGCNDLPDKPITDAVCRSILLGRNQMLMIT